MDNQNTKNQLDMIQTGSNLRELKEHGDLDFPLGVYEIDMKNMYMEMIHWHWHDELEFILIKEGCGDFYVSNDCYTLCAGQGILVNQGALHSYQINPEHENCKYHAIVFHPTLLFSHGQAKSSSVYLQPILSDSALTALPLTGATPREQSILELMDSIVRVNLEKKYCYELYTKQYMFQIWIHLLEHRQGTSVSAPEIQSTKVSMDEIRAKEAIRYIEEHYAEAITLDDIAASIHVSKSECCRCIRRSMKMTPFEYLMKYRIYVAAGMLIEGNSNESIAVLASKVGFNSSSYFNKLFRKYMKCTPTQYKTKLLAELGAHK